MRKDTESIEQNKKDLKKEVIQEVDDIKHVMSSKQGRRFVLRLIERAGIYRCSFSGQSNQTIFNEGGRNQGLILLNEITEHTPGSFQLMMEEKNNG